MKPLYILLHYIIVNDNKKSYYASLNQVRSSLIIRAKLRHLSSWRDVLKTDCVLRCYGKVVFEGNKYKVIRLYDAVSERALCSAGI